MNAFQKKQTNAVGSFPTQFHFYIFHVSRSLSFSLSLFLTALKDFYCSITSITFHEDTTADVTRRWIPLCRRRAVLRGTLKVSSVSPPPPLRPSPRKKKNTFQQEGSLSFVTKSRSIHLAVCSTSIVRYPSPWWALWTVNCKQKKGWKVEKLKKKNSKKKKMTLNLA